MASDRQSALYTLSRIGATFPGYSSSFHDFCLKPKQVQCFESLLNGTDVVAVFPTGFGKSLIFHLLPDILTTKSESNIVLVISPLTSIIEDQTKVLKLDWYTMWSSES